MSSLTPAAAARVVSCPRCEASFELAADRPGRLACPACRCSLAWDEQQGRLLAQAAVWPAWLDPRSAPKWARPAAAAALGCVLLGSFAALIWGRSQPERAAFSPAASAAAPTGGSEAGHDDDGKNHSSGGGSGGDAVAGGSPGETNNAPADPGTTAPSPPPPLPPFTVGEWRPLDQEQGQLRARLGLKSDELRRRLHFTADGRRLLFAHEDSDAEVVEEVDLPANRVRTLRLREDRWRVTGWHLDGALLGIASDSHSGALDVGWMDLTQGLERVAKLNTWSASSDAGLAGYYVPNRLAIVSDGKFAMFGKKVLDRETLAERADLGIFPGVFAAHESGRLAVLLKGGVLGLFSLANGQRLGEIAGLPAGQTSLAWSSAADMLATQVDSEVLLWEVHRDYSARLLERRRDSRLASWRPGETWIVTSTPNASRKTLNLQFQALGQNQPSRALDLPAAGLALESATPETNHVVYATGGHSLFVPCNQPAHVGGWSPGTLVASSPAGDWGVFQGGSARGDQVQLAHARREAPRLAPSSRTFAHNSQVDAAALAGGELSVLFGRGLGGLAAQDAPPRGGVAHWATLDQAQPRVQAGDQRVTQVALAPNADWFAAALTELKANEQGRPEQVASVWILSHRSAAAAPQKMPLVGRPLAFEGVLPPGRRAPSVQGLYFSPDASRLAIAWGADAPTVQIWRLGAEHRCVCTLQPVDQNRATGQEFVFDSAGAVVAAHDGEQVHRWDAATGEPLLTLAHAPRGDILKIALGEASAQLVVVQRSGTVDVWNLQTNTKASTQRLGLSTRVSLAAVDATGRLVAGIHAISPIPLLEVLDLHQPEMPARLALLHDCEPTSLAFSASGGELLVGNRDGRLEVWSLRGEQAAPRSAP